MEKELEVNAKRMSPEEQYQIRKSIIRLMKLGKSNSEIAEATCVSERHVRATKKSYREKGLAGITPKKRGRRTGDQRILTPEQEKEIRGIIIDKKPEQFKMKCCLWTRKSIRELIMMKYKINMGLSTLGYYLQRWGFSIQRPIKKARKQNPEQIQKWMEEEYPSISERAKAEKAEIYWGDETGMQNTANYAKGYAPIGQAPVLEVDSVKMKINLLSAISNQGKLRFTITREAVNADVLIDFMKRLVKDAKCKVFFILDNLRVHHAKIVTAWLEEHRKEIEVFYLPPYAPEHNPDEYLNSNLKRDVGSRPMPKSEDEIEHNTRSCLKTFQMSPEHVKAFFHADTVCYAA
jgi:transposase